MTDDELSRAVEALGGDIRVVAAGLSGSGSGAGVHLVRAGSADAVLKVATAAVGHRELAFYRTLAHRMPVETPRLLGFAETGELTVMLLSAHTPSRPAPEWDHAAWLEVARQLAALHSVDPPAGEPWHHTPWLRQVLASPPLATARDYWSAAAAPILTPAADLAAALDAVPDRFVHGDLHVDNLLRDGDRLVWADWQVAGIGNPAADLAFLCFRATIDGADVPHDEMVEAYLAARATDPALFRRAVVASEIGLLLFGFPPHADRHTPRDRDYAARRLRRLVARWADGEARAGTSRPGPRLA